MQMSDTVFITELKLDGVIVYRREQFQKRKDEKICFSQFWADAITGEEIADNEVGSRT